MRVSSLAPHRIAILAFAALAALGPMTARGAGPSTPAKAADPSLQEQIEQLKRDVQRLERANRAVEPMVDEKITKQYVTAGFNLKDGFFIQDPTKEYRLRFGGYTQLDGRFFISDNQRRNPDQFLFRRVRPILEGSLTRFVDFKIMPDFAGSSFTLFDAYVDIKPFDYYRDWLKIRAGKYKTPLGLDRLQSATALPLVERGAPTNLVPTRDIGIELWGAPWGGTLIYELGVFDGAADLGNVNGNFNDDFTFAGRLLAQPFATWPADSDLAVLRGVGVGIAGSWGEMLGSASNPDLPSYRSLGQATIFQYVNGGMPENTAFTSGTLTRINPQAYWYWGPLSFMAEYVRSSTPVQLADVRDNVANEAFDVTAGWVITGEDASYKGVTPLEPFDPWNGKWGAFELVARYDQLDIDKDAFRLGFADPKRSVESEQGFGGASTGTGTATSRSRSTTITPGLTRARVAAQATARPRTSSSPACSWFSEQPEGSSGLRCRKKARQRRRVEEGRPRRVAAGA
jgi:phosphate-selective porin OprO/OprP